MDPAKLWTKPDWCGGAIYQHCLDCFSTSGFGPTTERNWYLTYEYCRVHNCAILNHLIALHRIPSNHGTGK
ncbi:hypothetical protein J6590_038758 [Homalodisca vitripennis]|nr:hypothetical protein J6590_038758 [Homalodisca vitripennis]